MERQKSNRVIGKTNATKFRAFNYNDLVSHNNILSPPPPPPPPKKKKKKMFRGVQNFAWPSEKIQSGCKEVEHAYPVTLSKMRNDLAKGT